MRLESKRIEKDDGRYLIYYHNPESASPEETSVFEAINEAEIHGGTQTATPTTETKKEEGAAHV